MLTLPQTRNIEREIYAEIARVLRYPGAEYADDVQGLISALDAEYPDAAAHVRDFLDATESFNFETLQECYSRAFDVAPQCIPYLSVYLFGEESYKRSELMTGLLGAYEAAGYEYENELPDHLTVVLGYATLCSDAEWGELAHWCIPGPLGEMLRGLERAQNPYAHVLRALACVFKAHHSEEFSHV